MKRLLILALTALMTLFVTTGAMAVSLYLDYTLNGDVTDWVGNEFDTKTAIILGVKAPIDNWYLGFDYIDGKVDDGYQTPFSGYKFKGGYSFFNDDSNRVTATLGFLNETIETGAGDVELENVIAIGLDTDFSMTDNLKFGLEFDYAIANKEVNYYGIDVDLDSVLDYKLKLSYFFNDNIAASLGYYNYRFEIGGGYTTTSFSGITLGIVYKF